MANDTGMIWSGFRPSDDVCVYNFPIAQNMQVVAALGALGDIAADVYGARSLSKRASQLRREVFAGIERHGIIRDGRSQPIYAYAVSYTHLDVYKRQTSGNQAGRSGHLS